MEVTNKDCELQSQRVWNQFGEKVWIPTAKKNAELTRESAEVLRNVGIGRTLVAVGMGASLEDHIDILQKERHRFDVITCDKGFRPLMDRGIKADYVHLADTNILTKWIGHFDDTEDTTLIATPYANHDWTSAWKGKRIFYVNKDAIRSEKIFVPMFKGEARVVPAATNVSNAMIVFMTGGDEIARQNFAGYHQILMVGYDYSWRVGENYYAFNDPKPKRYYMAHRTMLDINKSAVRTSENLLFSKRWMKSYLLAHDYLNVWNCSGRGVLDIPRCAGLEDRLSGIQTDESKIKNLHEAFSRMKTRKLEFDSAKEDFKRATEEIYGSR